MMGYKYARNMYRLSDENILRINSASSWFSLHEYIGMHGQQNIKNRMYLCWTNNYLIFELQFRNW